jgi:shikimate kinase
MKIYLIGMPGSGKSTLGVGVAEALQLPFIDLDLKIQEHEGKTIPEIFLQNGEDHFRQVESKLLNEAASSSESFILATGGGAPCYYKGIDTINKSGLSIFLDVAVPELVSRLQTKNDRPLLGSDILEKEKILKGLREARLGCYRQARITIQNPDLNKILQAIHFKK